MNKGKTNLFLISWRYFNNICSIIIHKIIHEAEAGRGILALLILPCGRACAIGTKANVLKREVAIKSFSKVVKVFCCCLPSPLSFFFNRVAANGQICDAAHWPF